MGIPILNSESIAAIKEVVSRVLREKDLTAPIRKSSVFGDGPNHFEVDVVQTGGSAGGTASACTFTYTVKALDGSTLTTAAAPRWSRPSAGIMVAATHGAAYWWDGALILSHVDEVPSPETC